jgi:hypothetical protein
MFVKITNGQVEKAPYTIGEFRKAHPNKSFPKDILTNILEADGVYVIKETMHPTVDKNTHTYSWEVQSINGVWTQVWSTKQQDETVAAKNVREERDRLLVKSDWTQVADSPVDLVSWGIYREALRNIPNQEGFPFNVEWPQKPE